MQQAFVTRTEVEAPRQEAELIEDARRRVPGRFGVGRKVLLVAVATMVLSAVGLSGTASAQASFGFSPASACGNHVFMTALPNVTGEQGSYTSGGVAHLTAELYKYNYSTRSWMYVTNSRLPYQFTANIVSKGANLANTQGTTGTTWGYNGAWVTTAYWTVPAGAYAAMFWVSDGYGQWVRGWSASCVMN